MAKYSHKLMGKEVGDASVYAEPHTITGQKITSSASKMRDPNTIAANQKRSGTGVNRVSQGDPGRDDVKTSGIKIRGVGAAVRGIMARGPMG
jgi:hypothetical protein